MTQRVDIAFTAEGGVTLRGWLYLPEGPGPHPAITMGHGYACMKEHGLERFAEAFAADGFVVLLHDYRTFGASDGAPRQDVDPWQQIADWRRAVSFLESRPQVDAGRIGLWGTSYAGGHAIVLGATDRRLRCVVAQVPTISGYEPGAWISKVSPTPLLLVVADHDTITVTDLALAAYQRALEPKKLVLLPGGHFDPYLSRFGESSAAARDWFRRHLSWPRSSLGPRLVNSPRAFPRPPQKAKPDMSNTEIVAALKTAFAGYESNDRGPLTALLSDDFTFEMSDSMPYGGTYVGLEEFAAFWQEVGKEWRYFRYDAHEIIDAGDTIIVPVKTDALSIRGITMRNEHLFLFKVKDGRLVFGRLYADTARGRDVIAGLEPRRYPRPQLRSQTPGNQQPPAAGEQVSGPRTRPRRGSG
jgi:fermentation-respiration switch protein FrsA (DUF1100 family)/ketosteroid isomerase-like protein